MLELPLLLRAPSVASRGGWSTAGVLAVSLLVRVLTGVWCVRTYFNPDEYWQSSEIAHDLVYGYGHRTWEWRDGAQIRGFAHPLLFALLFKVLQAVGLDNGWMIANAPRILQAVFAAVGDVFTYRLARRYFGNLAAKWTLVLQLTCWFSLYALVRTFSNSIEAVCVTAALSMWPWPNINCDDGKHLHSHRITALCLACVGIVFRPTSAILWLFLGVHYLVRSETLRDPVRWIVTQVLPVGALWFTVSLLIDRIFYGNWTLVQINFIRYNIFYHVDEAYGTHVWHWYFSEGIPSVLGTMTPLLLLGFILSRKVALFSLIIVHCVAMSLSSHKELRFLLPVLPAMLCYCGYAAAWLQVASTRAMTDDFVDEDLPLDLDADAEESASEGCEEEEEEEDDDDDNGGFVPRSALRRRKPPPSRQARKASPSRPKRFRLTKDLARVYRRMLWRVPLKWLIGVILVTNMVAFAYFGLLHQAGPISAVVSLRHRLDAHTQVEGAMAPEPFSRSVFFLMPCHATPLYSALHTNSPVSLRFLDCSPRLRRTPVGHLRATRRGTDSARFEDDPAEYTQVWLKRIMRSRPPDYIVMFDHHYDLVEGLLDSHGYREIERHFHSHFDDAEFVVLLEHADTQR